MRRLHLAAAFLFTLLALAILVGKTQAAPSDYYDTVQKCYIGYYQRPADPGGLVWWAERLNEANGNLNSIIEAFAKSDESKALYGEVNNNTIGGVVDGIYMGLLSRTASQLENDYWSGLFKEGKISSAAIMLIMLNGAQNEDLTTINNKVTAANLFTRAIDPELDGANLQYTYSGNAAAQKARTFLSAVTSNPSTLPNQQQTIACLSSMGQYSYTILPSPGDYDSLTKPLDINDNGVVVGVKGKWGKSPGFLYSKGTYTTLLPADWPYGGAVERIHINNKDQVVAAGLKYMSDDTSGYPNMFASFFYSNGTYTSPCPPGWYYAQLEVINNNGDIWGYGYAHPSQYGLFFYSNSTGNYTTMGYPDPFEYAHATGINDNGAVVGSGQGSILFGYKREGFVYSAGNFKMIASEGHHAWLNGINKSGLVVGAVDTTAFVLVNDQFTTLLPEGWTNSEAMDINDSGEVVGHGQDGSGTYRIFIYNNGNYTILSPPGLTGVRSCAINNKSEVVGYGTNGSGGTSGFIATPN